MTAETTFDGADGGPDDAEQTATDEFRKALTTIVAWANRQPRWISAALISLAEGKSEADLVESLTKLSHAEASGDVLQPFVTLEQLTVLGSDAPVVNLVAVSNVEHVNQLAGAQTLNVNPAGLTIIYGKNGAGKSGYTRILRQVCTVRGKPGNVLPNVFSKSPGAGTAALSWQVNGVDGSGQWTKNVAFDNDLKHVHIFDSHVAAGQVHESAEAAFVPQPVQLLEAIGRLCELVKAQHNIVLSGAMGAALELPELVPGSAFADSFDALGSSAAATADAILLAAALSEAEIATQASLRKNIADASRTDLLTQQQALIRRQTEHETISDAVTKLDALFGDVGVEATRAAADDLASSQAAARSSADLNQGFDVNDIDNSTWRAMWESARTYSSEVVYPDHAFPHTADEARCVLCNQSLASSAKQRFVSIEQFVSDRTQQRVDRLLEAADEWSRATALTVTDHGLSIPLELKSVIEVEQLSLDGVASLAEDLGARFDVHDRFRHGIPTETDVLTSWSTDSVAGELAVLATILKQRIDDITDLRDEETIRGWSAALAVLDERAAITHAADTLRAEEERRRSVAVLNLAVGSCRTNPATILNRQLSELLITEAMRQHLVKELEDLGADRLNVAIGGKSVKTVTRFQIELNNASGGTVVRDVLSEGEARIVGLAGFLMDLRSSGSRSGVVFDDPVSSLDHRFRERVAERLTAEAKYRQVVIFTHDLVFVDALAEQERLSGGAPTIIALQRGATGAGELSADLPSAGGNFESQLKHIDRRIIEATPDYERDEAKWELASRGIVGDLRTAWERGIEELLLQKSVGRFRASVHTTRLRTVHVTDDLWKPMEVAMTTLSGRGPHDLPGESLREALTLPKLKEAVEGVRAWKVMINVEKKLTQARRDQIIPPATS
jgi:ABC-type multidrug transport system ATPase subunit